MSQYTRSEIKAVMPMRGVETYTVNFQISTENGKTKWIRVPEDNIEEFLKVIEKFNE